jgi:dTDP-4-amino-4,6-dideoxygalactose transaminase
VKHCIATSNATVGLELAFIATAHALQWQGITLIFCDIAHAHLDPTLQHALPEVPVAGLIGRQASKECVRRRSRIEYSTAE